MDYFLFWDKPANQLFLKTVQINLWNISNLHSDIYKHKITLTTFDIFKL